MEPTSHKNKKSHMHHRSRNGMQTDEDHDDATKEEHLALELSVLLLRNKDGNDNGAIDADTNITKQQLPLFKPLKPNCGTVVVGRINTKSNRKIGPPSLMLNLRGNMVGRCCITELTDLDSWDNMPLGKTPSTDGGKGQPQAGRVVSSDSDMDHENEDASDDEEVETR